MILSYINEDLDSPNYKQLKSYLCELYGDIFLCEFNKDILISTERNPIILRDVITLYKPYIFIVNSLDDFPFSATGISELIMFLLNRGITFQSIDDNLYWNEENIIDVYPTVFDLLRNKST